jgi:ATP-dependent Clp protease ATP-binding subunit ClpC
VVFKRFTERARQVVVLAQDEARALKHNYIGTEHILLGLLREEEGLAARVLESLDITVEEVRAQVARIVGQGDEVTTGQIPFTPRAKKVLELALREALSLGHNYIGTEHILLGLVRENEGVAARILLDFDADAETVRNELLNLLSAARETTQTGHASTRLERGELAESVASFVHAPPRWEYHVLAAEGLQKISAEELNTLGREGWELVAITGEGNDYRLVFKRRAPSAG